jgi:FixJ family two-component response regulator
VESAEDGLAACLAHRRSVIVCDLELPGMNGLGFFQELTAKDNSVKILISGNAEFGMTPGMRRAGIDAFLAKPFTLEALLAAISNRLRLQNTHSESRLCAQYQFSDSDESGI